MKRTKSKLIEVFLTHVKQGLISGRDDSSGPEMLQEMVDALQEILSDQDTDKALQIKRAPGNPAKEKRNLMIAKIMRAYEKADEKKTAGYADVNVWLKSTGQKILSEKRIRKIFEEYRPQVEVLESTAMIIEMAQKAIAEQQQKTE